MSEPGNDELDLSGKNDGEGEPKRSRGRPSKDTVRTDVGKSIKEGLLELSDWIKERDPELADILSRDAPRMSNVLAGRAAKHARVAKGCERVFGADGPIGVLRAFGPFLRAVLERLPAMPVFGEQELPPDAEEHLAGHVPPIGDQPLS